MTGVREVLVTGAAGFVGRHTVSAFHQAGFEVSAVDLRPAPAHLARVARWVCGDFADASLLAEVARGRYGAVLHQAGISDTRALAGPALDETNVFAPARMAAACKEGGARFVYASSHSVYGVLHRRAPIGEDAEGDGARCSGPLNPYARSKLALDRLMREQYPSGLDWVGLRYTNVFGADEQDKGPMASILSQMLRQAAAASSVRLFDDSLTAARDYIPVETVAATQVLLAQQRVAPTVYNLGAGHAVSFAEVLQWCARLRREAGAGALQVTLVPNPVRTAYQYFTCADMTALDKALPQRPTVMALDIEARVAELFDIFQREGRG